MRARGSDGGRPAGLPDRDLWRRSRETEAPADEAEHLLDLAAFADNRLDDDETARLAAQIAGDAEAEADVAAARLLADTVMAAADPRIVARAVALADEGQLEARVLAFPARPQQTRYWHGAANWSGLAAAIAFAGWLGFDLGSGLSSAPPFGHPADEASASDLFDPAPLLLRDFTESTQI